MSRQKRAKRDANTAHNVRYPQRSRKKRKDARRARILEREAAWAADYNRKQALIGIGPL